MKMKSKETAVYKNFISYTQLLVDKYLLLSYPTKDKLVLKLLENYLNLVLSIVNYPFVGIKMAEALNTIICRLNDIEEHLNDSEQIIYMV